jgi:drug/metabolite transporter (DMT)-like permease
VALLDTAANVAYKIGIATTLTSVVVTLSSHFSAVTVLLAWVILRERQARWQWAGVFAILLGVLLVNLGA